MNTVVCLLTTTIIGMANLAVSRGIVDQTPVVLTRALKLCKQTR